MNITSSILRIHPSLKFWIDFIVENKLDGEWVKLIWLNNDIDQPTQVELISSWESLQKEIKMDSDISEYKTIEKKAIQQRTEYLTAEMMPEWLLKDMKLAKLTEKWQASTEEFNNFVIYLVSEYWEEILSELV